MREPIGAISAILMLREQRSTLKQKPCRKGCVSVTTRVSFGLLERTVRPTREEPMNNNTAALEILRKQYKSRADMDFYALDDCNKRSLQTMIETLLLIHLALVAACDAAIASPTGDTRQVLRGLMRDYAIARCDHDEIVADVHNHHTWTDHECNDLTRRLKRVYSAHLARGVWMASTSA